jgi:PPK2 family polyphosphate:nucleotide phosphotransferase
VARIAKIQPKLMAADSAALLVVFQAMDAAGKDGTIRAVLSGVNPAGVRVTSFKAPSAEELDHDFLWRIYRCLPERGQIGVFNRSHYEEVLVVRVHPEHLGRQRLPDPPPHEQLWEERYDGIREMERHLARSGTRIVKFWLNVSLDEQKDRFLDRAADPKANWKFRAADMIERARWDDYMDAYQAALRATSRKWAPWYAIPADDKKYMRRVCAGIIADTLESMDPEYPEPTTADRAAMKKAAAALKAEKR